MSITKASLIDLNGQELILDADADTSITADTDDQIDIKIAGSDVITLTSSALTFSPSATFAEGIKIDADNGDSPQLLFENSDGVTTDAAISTFDDSNGVLISLGSNFYYNSSGSETRFNTSEESAAVVLNRTGVLSLMTGGTGATASSRLDIDSSGNVTINARIKTLTWRYSSFGSSSACIASILQINALNIIENVYPHAPHNRPIPSFDLKFIIPAINNKSILV